MSKVEAWSLDGQGRRNYVRVPELVGYAIVDGTGAVIGPNGGFISQEGFTSFVHTAVGDYALGVGFDVPDGGLGLVPGELIVTATLYTTTLDPLGAGWIQCMRLSATKLRVLTTYNAPPNWGTAGTDALFCLKVERYP